MLREIIYSTSFTAVLMFVMAIPSTVVQADNLLLHAKSSGQDNHIVDLKFHEFFKLPVGPRGLEPTRKLLSLNGKRVSIIGYMVHQEQPVSGVFALTPLPVTVGDEDESLADDLPPATVYVHINSGTKPVFVPGLLKLIGILQVGTQEEQDGHVSLVRLQLDPPKSKSLSVTSN